MIVIERNGRQTVVTGWREWVMKAAAIVVVAAVLAGLAFLVLGIALGIGAFLLILIPAVVVVAIVGWFLQPPRR